MAKKVLKIVLLGIGGFTLIFVLFFIHEFMIEIGIIPREEEKPQISVEYKPDNSRPSVNEEEIPDSEYQDTIQEAIHNDGVKTEEGEEYQKNIDEIIKSWENDEYISIFFRSVKNKSEECFTMAKFKKKLINGIEQYVFLTAYPTSHEKNALYIGNMKSLISGQLTFSDLMQKVNIDPQNTRFVYGECRYSDVKKLKVEGQEPTEIIPYEVFGKKWYFWYYENLESRKAGSTLEFTY